MSGYRWVNFTLTRHFCFSMVELMRLVLLLVVSGFCIFDEEPLFDPSDWNILHIVMFLVCLWVVVWENTMRARLGQFVYKDQVLLYAFLTFWWHTETYARLIVIIFCLHCLTPLEIELMELTEVFYSASNWAVTYFIPTLLWGTSVMGLVYLLNVSLNWSHTHFQLILVAGVCLALLTLWVWLAWDLLFMGLSSYGGITEAQCYYLQTRSTLTHQALLGTGDAYDWHKEQTRPFVLRFEDLFGFSLQLLNIWLLSSCLYFWLFTLVDAIYLAHTASQLSYLQVGIGLRWLDHLLGSVALCFCWPLFLAFRITLRTPFEFGFLI